MSKQDKIREKAMEILNRPEFMKGIRWTPLVRMVAEETGENINTCSGSLWNLPNEQSDKVARPHKGLFILKQNVKLLEEASQRVPGAIAEASAREIDIYEPARIHLLGDEECTHAVVIGGSIFGKKWGTPDILGAIRAHSDAIYRPTLEIIAVEVKNADYSPVEALGQAMAYKLFAHRTWLVLPNDADLDRIEGIAISANIGLVSFKKSKSNDGFEFETLNRPVSGNPDFKEVNKILEDLKKKDSKKYNSLIKNESD
ncbi:MAG: hypothetical protein HKL90_02505 [Elusimicrobia bacterium]|nr:hypothetical protein [Elusimicrobiota bacterium]